jgi:hypothetical protein
LANLCIGFYGGEGHVSNVHEPLDIAGCQAHAQGEISAWIAKGKGFEADGLIGDLSNWAGMLPGWSGGQQPPPPSKQMTWNSKMLARTPILTQIRLTGRNKIM